MKLDAIAAIEAAYAPASTEEAWMQGILGSLAALDQGRGMVAMKLDASDPADIRITPLAAFRPDEEWLRLGSEANSSSRPEHLTALYWRPPPVALASRRLARFGSAIPREHEAVFKTIADVLGLFAVDNDDRGVFVGVPLPHGRAPAPRIIHLLGRIAAHIVSARRLRVMTNGTARANVHSEAVLNPSGSVCHATGGARDTAARDLLGAAVRRMEVARSCARRTEPEEAVELWRGLVNGQWSLVDHIESDGRRFVLARRNDPRSPDPKALSGLERQITAFAIQGHANKYIAYVLGIAPSTVSSHLRSACRKLGVASRHDLIDAFGGREQT